LKITHEGRATPISDDVAERASLLLISQPVTTVNQSGGITAHTINVTVNSPRSPSQQAKTWMLQPTKTHLSSFIEDGEILAIDGFCEGAPASKLRLQIFCYQ
jgi:hypothetical protein